MSNGSAQVGGLKFLKALVWIVYAIVIAASIIIAFGFFLLIFDASPSAGFAEFIYTAGTRFAAPFVGMIEPTELANGGVISWSALFAIAAYLVLGWIVATILDAISRSIYTKSRPAPAPVQPYAPQPAAPQPAPAPAPAPQPAAAQPTPAPQPAEPTPAQPQPAPAPPQPSAAPVAEPEPAPPAESPAPAEQPPAPSDADAS